LAPTTERATLPPLAPAVARLAAGARSFGQDALARPGLMVTGFETPGEGFETRPALGVAGRVDATPGRGALRARSALGSSRRARLCFTTTTGRALAGL